MSTEHRGTTQWIALVLLVVICTTRHAVHAATDGLRQSSQFNRGEGTKIDDEEEMMREWMKRLERNKQYQNGLVDMYRRSLTKETTAESGGRVELPDCEEGEILSTSCVFQRTDMFDRDMQDAFDIYTKQSKLARDTFVNSFRDIRGWAAQQLHKAAKECDYHQHIEVSEEAKTCYETHKGIIFSGADTDVIEATESRIGATNEAFEDLESIKEELLDRFGKDLKERCCQMLDLDDDDDADLRDDEE